MAELDRPFVYISSLMRTGSTVLAEALTRLPYAFIFNEPHIGKNDFQEKPGDVERLLPYGVHLEKFLRFRRMYAFLQRRIRWLGYRQDYMVRVLKYELIPKLGRTISQFGVKEIRNTGWENYLQHFPDMKVVMTGRDPRDIYLSTYYRWRRGLPRKRTSVTPDEIADELQKEFNLQLLILDATNDHITLRYEDLCMQPALINEVLAFVDSPIPTIGRIGAFTGRHPDRDDEYRLHGNQITAQRVQRWRRESNTERVEEAQRVFELMPEYTDFWDYTP